MGDVSRTVREVSQLVQVLTNCSSADAERASAEICRTPGAVELLASACGLSFGVLGTGGTITVAGGGATIALGGVGVPVWALGISLGALGGLGVKRFCLAVVNQTGLSIDQALKIYLSK